MKRFYNTRSYMKNYLNKCKTLGYSSILKGDKTENYIASIMREFKNINDVEVIGNNGGMFDIIYRYGNDPFRAIQVKTLVKNKYIKDYYSTNFPSFNMYPKDTLIVLTNTERNRFCLIPYSRINVKTLSLGFNNINKGKYRYYKYDDLEKFKRSFMCRSKYSTLYDCKTSMSENILKEFNSLNRLSEILKNLNLSFTRNSTNSNCVDCYIKDQPVQCKYSSSVIGYTCKFNLCKSSGRGFVKPYNEEDGLKYFIFEIGGKYQGNFCIIPIKVLIEKGYISSLTREGKKSINICVCDTYKDHWTKKYWNNFNLIKKEKKKRDFESSESFRFPIGTFESSESFRFQSEENSVKKRKI